MAGGGEPTGWWSTFLCLFLVVLFASSSAEPLLGSGGLKQLFAVHAFFGFFEGQGVFPPLDYPGSAFFPAVTVVQSPCYELVLAGGAFTKVPGFAGIFPCPIAVTTFGGTIILDVAFRCERLVAVAAFSWGLIEPVYRLFAVREPSVVGCPVCLPALVLAEQMDFTGVIFV